MDHNKSMDSVPESKSRRTFLKSMGVAAGVAASVPIATGVGSAAEAYVNPYESTYGDLLYTTKQSDLVYDTDIWNTTYLNHLGTYELSDGRYNHSYQIVNTAVEVNDGSKLAGIYGHTHEWDASNSNINVDLAMDEYSPNVGSWPPKGGDSALENIFETLLQTAAGELSDYAGVLIPGATILEEILNAVDGYDPGDNQKRWDWGYSSGQDTVVHQLDPIYRHDASEDAEWYIRSVASSLGNQIDFYSGDPPSLDFEPTDPSYANSLTGFYNLSFDHLLTDFDLSFDLLSAGQNGQNVAESKRPKVIKTPGLNKEDFYSLPSTASMTAKERQKFGVRDPTPEKKEQFETPDGLEIVSVVERYPMTHVLNPVQENKDNAGSKA